MVRGFNGCMIAALALLACGCGGGGAGASSSPGGSGVPVTSLKIAAIADTGNWPDSYEVTVPLLISAPAGDPLTITATVEDPTIVEAVPDTVSRTLSLRPGARGRSKITVEVRSATDQATASFRFTVRDVTRRVAVTSSSPAAEAIVLTNNGTAATDFDLTHNGHLAFSSMEQVLDAVRQLPDEVAAEPFERKLWRFVRDNTYHFPPVSGEQWIDGAWPTLNSFGFGFCSNVASVYVQIARAAGYEARVWELEGHVVPEIRLNGAWQMYDPDLGVYYHKADGTLAGVEDLAADPSLITSPIDPVFAPGANAYAYGHAYGQVVAGIYGSTADNLITPGYPAPEPFQGSRITLPAGARLVYPGVWTVAPTGYDGPTPYTVQQFRQARLELPAGFTGSIAVPWVLWDVQGSGTVRVLGQDFAAGSAALRAFLVRPGQPVTAIEAVDNPSGLALVMMINPLWYDTNSQNDLEFTGKDVWALDAGTYPLAPANRPPPPVPASLRRPRA